MKIRIVNLGFSVADGGGLQTTFKNGILSGAFTDWQERRVEFICHDTVAYRWQLADYTLSKEERFDSVHEVTESEWIDAHRDQGYLDSKKEYHHYKMNFNAEGVFEVVCSRIENKNER
jgi:hypothetical protein